MRKEPATTCEVVLKSPSARALIQGMSNTPATVASARVRLFARFVAMGVGGVVMLGAILLHKFDEAARQDLESRVRCQSTMVVHLSSGVLSGPLDDGNTAFAESLRVLGATTHTGYSLITALGVVVAEPMAEAPGEVTSQLERPEIALATREGVGVAERDGIVHVATAIAPEGVVIGYARGSVPASRVSPECHELETRIAVGGVIAVFASMVVAWLLAASMARTSVNLAPPIARAVVGDAVRPAELTQACARTEPEAETEPEPFSPALLEVEANIADESSSCSVAAVMLDVESLMRAGAIEKGLSLHMQLDTPIPARITADAAALCEMLTMLVRSATELTAAGTVSIEAGFDADAPLARRMRLTVSDTSATATPSEEMARGVDSARCLVRLLGGHIEVASTPGVGTAVTVLFPTGIRSHEMRSDLVSLGD